MGCGRSRGLADVDWRKSKWVNDSKTWKGDGRGIQSRQICWKETRGSTDIAQVQFSLKRQHSEILPMSDNWNYSVTAKNHVPPDKTRFETLSHGAFPTFYQRAPWRRGTLSRTLPGFVPLLVLAKLILAVCGTFVILLYDLASTPESPVCSYFERGCPTEGQNVCDHRRYRKEW